MLSSAFFGQYTIGVLLDLNWEQRDDSAMNELDGNRIYTVDNITNLHLLWYEFVYLLQ